MFRALTLSVLIAASPAVAQDSAGDIDRGADLLSEGARLLLRGLMNEVEPHMRDMAEALEGWRLEGLGIDDLTDYHAPEMLPNGDIILRRKQPLSPRSDGPEVDL